jgi:DNA primase
MKSHQSVKEEIKRVADIVEIIGQYVQLKKSGQNLMGLCPFHSEKAPSFTVNPAKQMFHCFGCKKGGDVFAFWMEYHKVSFTQALQDLAQRYHISLPERVWSPAQKKQGELRDQLYKINEKAADFFHHVLLDSEKGSQGRHYFEQRSFHRELIETFRLGYAPDQWDGLLNYLKKEGLDNEKAVKAGVIIPRQGGTGYYDRFRGRVMFPIFNTRQQVAGFGGRVLGDNLPKYINTPESPIFHKSELLYGLDRAHQSIRETGRVVIVEGYTDVLALHGHGFREAVATLGTALTKEHIRKLKGFAQEAIVVFDADAAGKGAALKSLPLFLNEGFSAKVMVLPEGEDPDSFLRQNGLDAFRAFLEKSLPVFDFYLDSKISPEVDSIEQKVAVMKEILPLLAELGSEAQRSLYIRQLSGKTRISTAVIQAELDNFQHFSQDGRQPIKVGEKLKAVKVKSRADFDLLNLLVHHPQTMKALFAHEYKRLLSDPVSIEIADKLYEAFKRDGKIVDDQLMETLEGPAQERFREIALNPSIYSSETIAQAVTEFEASINKLKLADSISQAKKNGDIAELNELLKNKNVPQV